MQIKRITVQTKVGIILRNEHNRSKPSSKQTIIEADHRRNKPSSKQTIIDRHCEERSDEAIQ